MAIRFLNSVTSTNSTFRVACGELVIDDLWSVHNELEFGVVKNGSVTVETPQGIAKLNKGDFYFIAPNQKHKFEKTDDASVEIVLLNINNFSAITQEVIAEGVVKSLLMGNCTKFAYFTSEDQYYQNVIECYNKIFQGEIEKPRCFQLLVAGKLYEFFYYMITSDKLQIFDVDAQGKKYRALRRITDYINENFCENISLDSVAEETGLSRYYVSHLFKELMNTTFINYLNELRLSRAALLLKTTDTPVIDIAGKSGFNNISNFNRAFKMFHGTTPSKYRKTERAFSSL